MNSQIDLFYFFMSGVALLVSMLGLWFTVIMPGIDIWSRRFFRIHFLALAFSCVAGVFELLLKHYPAFNSIINLLMVLEPVFLLLPVPMMTVYLLRCCGERIFHSRPLYLVLFMWISFLIMLSSAFFTGTVYSFKPDNQISRGPVFWLLPLPIIAIVFINLIHIIRHKNRLSQKVFLSFIITMIPMMATLLMQMFFDVYPLIATGGTLSALAMYGLILSDQIDKDLRHQQEIANQRASIMVLQMRPHFIYNTMTSIYCLCRQDPEKARQVVMDFTTYLRKNFTAIASEDTIPFSSELEHTRAYLAVEQAQYEDSLFVDYDTPHIWFRVPPLTLQPIVENAIKHGRDPYAGPFHITIQTKKTDLCSEITVYDNGRGYDPEATSEPHIALENIRHRLLIMCGGQLIITPRNGGGTVVKVIIPDRT